MRPDPVTLYKEIEDHLFPRKQLSMRERALYYHILRHTWLAEQSSWLFGLAALADALGVAESTVRDDVRTLHERGVLEIKERTRLGHRVAVHLPAEIAGVLPAAESALVLNLDDLDFFTERRFVTAIVAREDGRCFYCFCELTADGCVLDHAVPRAERLDNSYRNIVASCHTCNSAKQAQHPADFIRSLYRRGLLSQSDLENRLAALAALQAGELKPDELKCRVVG